MAKKLQEPPARCVVLAELGSEAGLRPPPPRGHPRYGSSSSSGCCCGCICWCCCCCFLLIFIIVGATVATLVYVNPKPPSYSVKNLAVTNLDISPEPSLHAKINVTIRAENPNSKIGFIYGKDSMVRLVYRETDICKGKMPGFYQGFHNTTEFVVALEGKSKFGPDMQEALKADKERGEVPVDIYVSVPVQLRIFGTDSKAVRVTVGCEVVLDDIDPKKKIGIKSSKYNVEW